MASLRGGSKGISDERSEIMSELAGQMEMEGLTPAKAAEPLEGYDAAGNLIDPGRMEIADGDARRLDVLAGEINLLEASAKETFRRTAMEIGRRLTEARNLVPRGRWGEWLEKRISYSARKAQQLMQVYEEYQGEALPGAYDRLSFTQLYDLLAAPPEERDALAERAASEDMSTRELKREIEELRRQKEQDNIKIFDLLQKDEASERALKLAEARATAAEDSARQARNSLVAESENSLRASKQAKDAVERANRSDAALTEARERIAALEAREPERVEVVPKETAREIEALKAQLEKAEAEAARLNGQTDAAAQAKAKRLLAAQLQARIAMKHVEAEAVALADAIKGVAMLDRGKADALHGEVKALAERVFGGYLEV